MIYCLAKDWSHLLINSAYKIINRHNSRDSVLGTSETNKSFPVSPSHFEKQRKRRNDMLDYSSSDDLTKCSKHWGILCGE